MMQEIIVVIFRCRGNQNLKAMLKLNIERLVKMRSKQRPLVYLITHGFTRDEARSLLNPRLKSVKLSMQTRLCLVFACEPNDLFGFDGPKDCHLNVLNVPDPPRLDNLLEGLSPKEIEELRRIADEQRRKKRK